MLADWNHASDLVGVGWLQYGQMTEVVVVRGWVVAWAVKWVVEWVGDWRVELEAMVEVVLEKGGMERGHGG